MILLRRIVAALCALAVASSGFAQAQGFRPGFGFARPGFQFLQSATGALCQNNSLAYYDFVANTGCSAGTNAANSTANLTTSRASIGYDLAATTQFAANVARRTGAGLLVEAAATNLQTQSQFASGWGANTATLSPSSAVSTDGTLNAASFSDTTANSVHLISGPGSPLTSGTIYTWSVRVKANGPSTWFFTLIGWGNSGAWFNLTGAGTAGARQGSVTSSSIIALGGGYYQVAVSGTAPSTNSLGGQLWGSSGNNISSYAGAPSNWSFFGAQTEIGSAPSSYIPTTTAAATRAADNITLTLPTGVTKVDLVYSTGTTTVTVSPGTYTLPPNPANSNLLQLKAYAG